MITMYPPPLPPNPTSDPQIGFKMDLLPTWNLQLVLIKYKIKNNSITLKLCVWIAQFLSF